VLSGVEDDLSIDDSQARYTRPDQVAEFVAETGCDSLAIAVGTSHGAYKFKGNQRIQFHILEEIQHILPGYPLVLHGGSAVNPVEIDRINKSGGRLVDGAAGVPHEDIARAIELGVCKINIATDARLLWARTHREFFRDYPDKFDPILPGSTYMEEFTIFMKHKFKLLGATGMASEYAPIKSIA
jgi:fructose-bisphosphate aldolase class II